MRTITGKRVLITGAAAGIGRALALELAKENAQLVLVDIDENKLQDIAAETRERVPTQTHVCDLSQPADITQLVRTVTATAPIDILVNNAGCNVRKPALEITWDDWNLVLETNLRGVFFVAQEHAARMVQRKYGRIINIGSVTCVNGYAGLGPYCGSRGGVKQLTMSLADDWGPHGVTVNCLAPGWFKTKQNAVMYKDEGWVDYLSDRIPLKRPGSPGDLHGAVVFLASEASAYMTGQTLLIDGGISTGAVRAVPK